MSSLKQGSGGAFHLRPKTRGKVLPRNGLMKVVMPSLVNALRDDFIALFAQYPRRRLWRPGFDWLMDVFYCSSD